MDVFFLDAPDVGRFQKLVMAHDNSGFGSAWKLAKVEIVNTNSGESCTFPANRWGGWGGGGLRTRDLKPPGCPGFQHLNTEREAGSLK